MSHHTAGQQTVQNKSCCKCYIHYIHF